MIIIEIVSLSRSSQDSQMYYLIVAGRQESFIYCIARTIMDRERDEEEDVLARRICCKCREILFTGRNIYSYRRVFVAYVLVMSNWSDL